MRQYITNLTDHLIRKNRYDHQWNRSIAGTHPFIRHPLIDRFIEAVKNNLEINDVLNMNPDTLGKIMCELEVGDVMAKKEELFRHVGFAGSCEDLLRGLVAACLAYAIKERLEAALTGSNLVPPWEGRVANMPLGAKEIIDREVAKRRGNVPDLGFDAAIEDEARRRKGK